MAWTDVEALKRLEIKSHVSPGDRTVALRAQAPWAPVAAESARRTRRSEMGILVEEGCGRGGSCWDARAFVRARTRLDFTVIMDGIYDRGCERQRVSRRKAPTELTLLLRKPGRVRCRHEGARGALTAGRSNCRRVLQRSPPRARVK